MVDVANYAAMELLRNGRHVEIRALRPEDGADFMKAVDQIGTDGLYRRFFGVRRGFTEQEIAFHVNVDFVRHVALIAVMEESGRPVIVGGGRYIVVQPGQAEMAFAVVDMYQGQGIGTALLRHLTAIAHETGIEELVADVLPHNIPMLKVFKGSGYPFSIERWPGAVHVTLRLS